MFTVFAGYAEYAEFRLLRRLMVEDTLAKKPHGSRYDEFYILFYALLGHLPLFHVVINTSSIDGYCLLDGALRGGRRSLLCGALLSRRVGSGSLAHALGTLLLLLLLLLALTLRTLGRVGSLLALPGRTSRWRPVVVWLLWPHRVTTTTLVSLLVPPFRS